MNEIQLSNDLNVITAEIKMLENNMTKSLVEHGWEIGKRLFHAKTRIEHGGFGDWLEKNFEFSHQYANQFMKFYRENPNYNSSSNFNKLPSWKHVVEVMYLPEKVDKEKFIEEKVMKEDGTTGSAKEIADYKKQIKEKDERIANLSETVKEMANQKPKVIEKVVTKEVVPPKYENLESDNQQLTEALKEARERELKAKQEKERIEKEILTRRKIENDDMEQAQLTRLQRSADINVHRLIINMNDFVKEQSITVYDSEAIAGASDDTKQKLNQSIKRVENLLKDIKQEIGGNVVWTIN